MLRTAVRQNNMQATCSTVTLALKFLYFMWEQDDKHRISL